MSWPTPQEYNEAIQNLQSSASDPELRRARVELNTVGLPRPITGAFASVYSVSTGSEHYAVRCFLTRRPDLEERYRQVVEHSDFDKLGSTIGFDYVERGLKVKGAWYPCLKMEWIKGQTLDSFVGDHKNRGKRVEEIAISFRNVMDEWQKSGLAHGDLQHGNILVTDNGIKLVDYDSIFVPSLEGKMSLELGHPNYQHPERSEYHFGPALDNFSAWLIYLSLICMARDKSLVSDFHSGEDSLLFKRRDLDAPEKSALFQRLASHEDEEIRRISLDLQRMLWVDPLSVPPLNASDEELETLPAVRPETVEDVETSPRARKHSVSFSRYMAQRSSIEPKRTVAPTRENKGRESELTKHARRLWFDTVEKLDVLFIATVPIVWVGEKLRRAKGAMRSGEYHEAVKELTAIFTRMEHRVNMANQNYSAAYQEALLLLGYAHSALGNSPTATNYLKIALHRLNPFDSEPQERMRVAFLLAVANFDAGNRQESFSLLGRYEKELEHLEIMVAAEIESYNFQLAEPALDMLIAYRESLKEKLDSKGLSIFILPAAFDLLWTLRDKKVIDAVLLRSFMHLAWLHFRKVEYDEALDVYLSLAELCRSPELAHPKRTALICAATITNLKGEFSDSLEILGELGKLEKEEFHLSVEEAIKHLPVRHVLSLLLTATIYLRRSDNDSDTETCFETACRLSFENEGSAIVSFAHALEWLDEEVVIRAMSRNFLFEVSEENYPLKDLIAALVSQKRVNLLTAMASYLISNGKTRMLAPFATFLLETGEMRTVMTVSNMLQEEHGHALFEQTDLFAPATDKLVDNGIKHLNSTFETLENRVANSEHLIYDEDLVETSIREISLAFHLLEQLAELETTGEIDSNMRRLFDERYDKILETWIFGLVAEKRLEQVSSILFRLLMHGEARAIDRIFIRLCSNEGSKILRKTVTGLVEKKGCSFVVASLGHRLAQADDLTAFIWVTMALIDAKKREAVDKLEQLLEESNLTNALSFLKAALESEPLESV